LLRDKEGLAAGVEKLSRLVRVCRGVVVVACGAAVGSRIRAELARRGVGVRAGPKRRGFCAMALGGA
ncbi:MAG: hypothetical protein J7M21_03785, partial [Planctomycetes bacterium]|nr:hypothetical protein [Planctomycetota bacterium]